jgi:hypothetical protein
MKGQTRSRLRLIAELFVLLIVVLLIMWSCVNSGTFDPVTPEEVGIDRSRTRS